MKYLVKVLCITVLSVVSNISLKAQTVLIDHHFQTTTLPAGVTSNGAINPTKAADGVCTQGMIQVNSGQFMQVDIPGCSLFRIHAKSTSSTARVVTIKYKKRNEAIYTTLAPNLSVQTAAAFTLSTLYPALITNDSISVRIEAGGNIQIHDLYVEGNSGVSNAAEITAFKLPGQLGNELIFPANDSIFITVPLGTNLAAIIPQQIIISAQATLNPAANVARDFSSVISYAVTAQDGITVRNWKVKVQEVASSEKEIIAFKLANNQIGEASINSANATIQVFMPIGAVLSNLVPLQFSVSPFANVSPLANAALDFSNSVQYTVTAQDNSAKVWTVSVQLLDPNAVFTNYEAEDAAFTGKVDNVHANYSGTGFIDFLATGENFVLFTVCQTTAGNQTAKFRYSIAKDEIRRGALYVNDIFQRTFDFPRTATFADWSEEVAVINLPAGVSRIKLVWDSTDGPNLDKLMLSGLACNSYTLNVSSTNNGKISMSPERKGNRYFENETVTLYAENLPALVFNSWTGDVTGSANPTTVLMNGNKNVVGNFSVIPTFKLNTSIIGLGEIILNPAGGEYAINTIVTATAKEVLGSTFQGWAADASGTNTVVSITMDATKNITANFSAGITPNFEQVVGFASAPGDGFAGPVTGGQCAPDTLIIIGPSAFNTLCESLYNRQRAFKTNTTVGGMKKAPLVILLKAGVYDGSQSLSSTGANAFANYMLDIAEQADLTFIGQNNVTFKFGINVKRSWNVLIRNISFYDYQDDGINVGYPETHHIWIDHCTFGHPVSLPADKEVPDGGCEIKDGASFVTVSWCKFQNHWKTSLNGHSDNNGATDAGRLKITYYANYFYSTNSRNPRVRFGQVHVLNNLFENVGLGRSGQLGYGIAASNNSQVVAESNFFLDTRWPMFADRTTADFSAVYGPNLESPTGNKPCFGIKPLNNAFDDAGLTQSLVGKVSAAMLNPSSMSIKFDSLTLPTFSFNPSDSYDYSTALVPAAAVRTLIPFYAGADKITFSASSCASLPVTIINFYGRNSKGKNELHWKVAQQNNIKRYEIESSADGNNFVKIGDMPASASSQYQFTHVVPNNSSSWYRLKIMEIDGTSRYSKTILLHSEKVGALQVLPNPTSGLALVQHPTAQSTASISICNMLGATLLVQQVQHGVNNTMLNLGKLPSGNYWIVFKTIGVSRTARITKW